MIEKHHSVNHVFAAHPELLPMSKSTFYRYVDIGLLNVRNIDLARKYVIALRKNTIILKFALKTIRTNLVAFTLTLRIILNITPWHLSLK